MAKRGVDDAMFCEACGAHRDQLGLAGDDIRTCPECDRATCSNCWNQIAGACLTCRAFALPIATAPTPTPIAATATPLPKAPSAPPVAAAIAALPTTPKIPRTPRPSTPRRFKRAAKPQPDPLVSQMPGVVEPALATTPAGAASATLARFGHIRIGRVIRATAIGSVLAVSIAAVGFAGVLRLGPSAEAAPQFTAPQTAPPRSIVGEPAGDAGPVATDVARPTPTPAGAAVTTGPDDRGVSPASNGTPSGNDPTDGPPPATDRPAGTATPTAGATATATAEPTPTPDPTAEPTPTPEPTATPTPEPDPTPTPEPDPTPTPEPDPTPTPTPVATDTP